MSNWKAVKDPIEKHLEEMGKISIKAIHESAKLLGGALNDAINDKFILKSEVVGMLKELKVPEDRFDGLNPDEYCGACCGRNLQINQYLKKLEGE